ncbi:MAG: hypothetical protein ABR600_03495 [Actinomycetota bacterium]
MNVADLLELLHVAPRRYTIVSARVRCRKNSFDRWGRTNELPQTDETFEVRVEERPGGTGRANPFPHQHFEWGQCAFDPNVVIPELWLEPVGRTRVAGREAIAVRATPRATTHDYFVLPMRADRYELAVDGERGVLLRLKCLVNGNEALVYEVERIAFDGDALDP